MANSVTTSIVVQFTQGTSSGALVVEVDDREVADGGLNGGKTSFLPGDPVNLLLFKSSNVTLGTPVTSLGSLAASGSAVITKVEDVTFANETQATVRYPIGTLSNTEWIGTNLGTVTVVDQNTVRIPDQGTTSAFAGIARLTYTSTATIYKLTHSAQSYSEYGIVVFFSGTTP